MGNKEKINFNTVFFYDIETSTIQPDQDTSLIQVPYHGNLIEFDMIKGKIVSEVNFSTIREAFHHFYSISSKEDVKMVYCVNSDYELSFILREFEACSYINKSRGKIEVDEYGEVKHSCVIRDRHTFLEARLDCLPYVIIRDLCPLTGKGVEGMGKELMERDEVKKLGLYLYKLPYDYELPRLPHEERTKEEIEYNRQDNLIAAYYLHFYLKDRNKEMKDLKLTFTSEHKEARKDFIKENFSSNTIRDLNIEKKLSYELFRYDKNKPWWGFNFYDIQLKSFEGGLTSANINYLDIPLKDIYSMDIKSSYPFQMVSNKFPVYKNLSEIDEETGEKRKTCFYLAGTDADLFYKTYLHKIKHKDLYEKSKTPVKGYYATIRFKGLKVKNKDYLLSLSKFHVLDSGEIPEGTKMESINGKIRFAEEITFSMTNVKLDIINLVYDYDEIEVLQMYVSIKDKTLHEAEIHNLLRLFDTKENIDKTKFPIEYVLSKGAINGNYGIKVQKDIKDRNEIIDGEVITTDFNKLKLEEKERIFYNYMETYHANWNRLGKNSKSFDIFSDGVYITDFARYQLVEMMVRLTSLGFIVVYCDTDCLKFMRKEKCVKKPLSTHNPLNNLNYLNYLNYNKNNYDSIISNLVDNINNEIIENNKNNIRFKSYKEFFNVKDKDYNKMLKLGTWDLESIQRDKENNILSYSYPYFKTLGAKKYCYITEKYYKEIKGEKADRVEKHIHTVLAGCSTDISEAIEKYSFNEKIEFEEALQEVFIIGTRFDKSCSGKTVPIREDRDRDFCRSLTYKGVPLDSAGGTIIKNTSYKLNISLNDSKVLDITRAGEDEYFQSLDKEGILTYKGY